IKKYLETPSMIRKYMSIQDTIIGIFIIFILIGCGFLDKNWILSNSGKGLFQHLNIWLFIVINIFQPLHFIASYKSITRKISKEFSSELQKKFLTDNIFYSLITPLVYSVGFIVFLYNSLQNAGVLNHLPFDYWDNIKYGLSYLVSRIYKFYLYSWYFPRVSILVLKTIYSIAEILKISEHKIKRYPFEEYLELNILCNFGLNILTALSVPLLALFSGTYLVHNRIDSTVIFGGLISFGSSLFLLFIYFLMIKNYRISVLKYKNHHIKLIDQELSSVYDNIINDGAVNNSILEKSKYLEHIKQKIETIDAYPLLIKAIITSFLPTIPMLIKILQVIFEYISK
ncbi:hypothetical protein V9Z07_10465, partial [Streptococcus suis]